MRFSRPIRYVGSPSCLVTLEDASFSVHSCILEDSLVSDDDASVQDVSDGELGQHAPCLEGRSRGGVELRSLARSQCQRISCLLNKQEVVISAEQSNCVSQCISCDQEIERLDGNSASPQCKPQVTCLLPQCCRLMELMTGFKQWQDSLAASLGTKSSPKFRKNRTTNRSIVHLEQ